ncbi:MAG: sulfatase-like hydrolase/transferase [Rhizobiales bacterium]|nr:sulfatase-like hydrolase/transferase [Hyphomicrobiales bacterium]MBO6699632.1 sulfatase-like hydrolase/transferase [Hyphomicrobiales bacterium]MBO6737170.1 sulfatase-like hydrolase/transferase [Hyphomicrobiales bacterium]MBO6911756.1 sulfatase-like hydrolase/transferase [Hyphomicrobiales bacterium]MBO6954693.1 sulfatase-like hydrolase/transferase [Hyphomicrobiales bacterium]
MNPSALTPALRLVLAALVFHLVLIQPNHPAAMSWGALLVLPLELPVVLLALLALGDGRAGAWVRGLLVAVLTLLMVLKTADYIMFTALNRGFNPVADLPLVVSFAQLIAGTFGMLAAVLAVVGAVLLTALVAAFLWWASGVWASVTIKPAAVRLASVGAVLFAGVAAAEIGHAMGRWNLPAEPPGAAFTARVGVERIGMTRETLADLRAFRSAALADPYRDEDGLLDLIDRDVVVLFVESYGRTSFDTPLYADLHRQTLEAAEAELGDLGFAMASSFLSSPTRGGQSWLAHATFANGLWIDDQASYGAALASGRQTLFHIAARSGFRTAAVMPQITLEWPESQFMGFDTVLAAADLGYQGEPFNWVTMPDQFTLAALNRHLREERADDQNLFVQVALGSSHAPWVPVPTLVDWETIGDGQIFNAMAASGDAPDIVWRDRDRVRAQYRLAVDYALQTVFAYAARQGDEPPLLVVIGDHQAASFVALDERPDVPIHVIGVPALVDRLADHGFVQGLIPPDDTPVRSMAGMRGLILDAFSSNPIEAAAR